MFDFPKYIVSTPVAGDFPKQRVQTVYLYSACEVLSCIVIGLVCWVFSAQEKASSCLMSLLEPYEMFICSRSHVKLTTVAAVCVAVFVLQGFTKMNKFEILH